MAKGACERVETPSWVVALIGGVVWLGAFLTFAGLGVDPDAASEAAAGAAIFVFGTAGVVAFFAEEVLRGR